MVKRIQGEEWGRMGECRMTVQHDLQRFASHAIASTLKLEIISSLQRFALNAIAKALSKSAFCADIIKDRKVLQIYKGESPVTAEVCARGFRLLNYEVLAMA